MSKQQDRLFIAINALLADGWEDDGYTHQNNRKILKRGTARCTIIGG